MSLEDNMEEGKGFKSISKLMYEDGDYNEFFLSLEACGVNLPTSLEVLQEEVFPAYELMRDYNNIDLATFLIKCMGFYMLKSADYIDDSDTTTYEEYLEMAAFLRLELDRLWVYEKIFSATSTKPAKPAKQPVAVRQLLLQAALEKPEWVQKLSKQAKIIFYHIILNCDKRAVIGFENSKAFSSKESTYILQPEHYQEVEDIIDMLKEQ